MAAHRRTGCGRGAVMAEPHQRLRWTHARGWQVAPAPYLRSASVACGRVRDPEVLPGRVEDAEVLQPPRPVLQRVRDRPATRENAVVLGVDVIDP